MAAKTPSTITPINEGNRNGFVAKFADIDDADTWASGLSAEPLHVSINNTTDGVVISETFLAGTFTFTVAGSGSNKTATVKVVI